MAMINLPAPQQQLQHHPLQHQSHPHQPPPQGQPQQQSQQQQQPQPPPPQQSQQQQPQQPQQSQQQPPYGSARPEQQPQPYVGQKGEWVYKLQVEQQPIRARMCGFGDKDRRPITSPPCIRLSVYDTNTGKEIDFNDVDSTFYVLIVDLWDSEGQREVNLVRHSSGAPTVSISSSTTTSYPPPVERPAMYMASPMVPQYDSYGRPLPGQPNPYGGPQVPSSYYGAPTPGYQYGAPNPYGNQVPVPMQVAAPQTTATGMFTRNLIGSLTVNASRLTDTEGKWGFWFVLQDLSVRTEGVFRLKMNFVDVGSGLSDNRLNIGRAPVLASCFSDPFQVYSAKKFPGVIESTPLSKAFAAQGIKIPIRKDGPKTLSNQHEYDNDE